MNALVRARTTATLVGILAAGILYSLATLKALAACGQAMCVSGTLPVVRQLLITIALPFAIAYGLTLVILAVVAMRTEKKKRD
jgi:hypothetical protein